jgi:predicted type IV restriction endonuclease
MLHISEIKEFLNLVNWIKNDEDNNQFNEVLYLFVNFVAVVHSDRVTGVIILHFYSAIARNVADPSARSTNNIICNIRLVGTLQ